MFFENLRFFGLGLLLALGVSSPSMAQTKPFTYVEPEEGVPSSYIVNLMKGDPQAYFAEINAGWAKDLYASLKSKMRPGRSYIVLHNRLPFKPIDLRSTQNFKLSLLSGKLEGLFKMDLGHVMIAWHCEAADGTLEGATGFTGELNQQSMGMIGAGWGFTGLFSLYNDGHLQTSRMAANVMRNRRDSQFVSLAVEVDAAACRQLTSFVGQYVFRADKPYRHFGLNADPAKFEGAGCGSFGVTATGLTGVFPEVFPSFWRKLYANRTLMGYDIDKVPPMVSVYRVPYQDLYWHNKINVLDVLFKNWDDHPGPSLRIMDPEMLYLFQRTVFRQSVNEAAQEDPPLARRLARGPFVHNRVIRGSILRTDDDGVIDTEPVVLDETFDDQAERVVTGSRRWLGRLRAGGYSAKAFEFNGYVGVLLSR